MYLLICVVNSYLYDISMECKVYMSSSIPSYQYVCNAIVCSNLRYITQHIVDNATS